MRKICFLLISLLVLCNSVLAAPATGKSTVEPVNTSNTIDVIAKNKNISIGNSRTRDMTPEQIKEMNEKDKTEFPKINAVQNMYDMKEKIAFRRSTGGTNCAWTVAWAYKGTPYGQVSEYDNAVEAQEHTWAGSISEVGQLMYIAAMNNQLITDVDPSELIWGGSNLTDAGYNPSSAPYNNRGPYISQVKAYQPQPGDLGIESSGDWHFQHVFMVRAKEDGGLGTIENGGSGSNTYYGTGGIHDNRDRSVGVRDVVAWIKASDYANAVYPVGGGVPGSGGSAYQKFVFGNIYDMGKSMCVIMEKFAELCEESLEKILPVMIPLFWLMAIIDLTMTVMLAGFEINPFTVIIRFLKYGFFYYLIANWPELVDNFFLSFAFDTANGANVLTDTTITMNITNPQLILQKGLLIIKPGIDYVSALSTAQMLVHIFTCMMVTAFSLITMLSLMALSIYVMISYIEFYVVATLAVVTLPYTPSGFTKWIPQASIASVWKQTIRLFTLSIFIGLIGQIFAGTSQADIIKKLAEYGMHMNETWLQTAYSAVTQNTQMIQAVLFYGGLCLQIITMCLVTFFISQKVANKLSPSGPIQW